MNHRPFTPSFLHLAAISLLATKRVFASDIWLCQDTFWLHLAIPAYKPHCPLSAYKHTSLKGKNIISPQHPFLRKSCRIPYSGHLCFPWQGPPTSPKTPENALMLFPCQHSLASFSYTHRGFLPLFSQVNEKKSAFLCTATGIFSLCVWAGHVFSPISFPCSRVAGEEGGSPEWSSGRLAPEIQRALGPLQGGGAGRVNIMWHNWYCQHNVGK